MADYILIRKSRNILSTVVHILMNVALGAISIFVTAVSGSWALGIVLVLLSKWRIFAVRPRFWFLNLKSNLVDLIVGISFVLIAYCAGTTILPVHYVLAIGYIVWLLVLKPRSSEIATELQSEVAVFLGTTATILITVNLNSFFVAIFAYLIGYAASRHVLVQSDSDNDFALVTRICGLLCAEIAWLMHSWLIVYSFGGTGIIVPQLSIILTVFAFAFGRIYKSLIKHDGKLKIDEILIPTLFSLAIIAMVVIWFSKPIFDV